MPGVASLVSTWRTPPEISACNCTTGTRISPFGAATNISTPVRAAVAGCFVHERHARNLQLPRFAGWWGHDKQTRFRMGRRLPGHCERRRLAGEQSFDSLDGCAPRIDGNIRRSRNGALRAKSEMLTGYLEFLLAQDRSERFSIITPRNPAHRGAQLSLRLARGGRAICDTLASQGVICDWREPDILRVAPVPLYNSFSDVFTFVEEFRAALQA